MPSPIRQKRVADRLLQETSRLLQEMNDARLALVSVTLVNIDRELEYANVFVSTVGDAARRKEVMQVLNGAKGYIRREIARRVQLRRAPELIFHWDPSPEKAEHIAHLLDEIKTAGTEPTPLHQDAPEEEAADAGDDDR
jgi:ribosome-binding factor A